MVDKFVSTPPKNLQFRPRTSCLAYPIEEKKKKLFVRMDKVHKSDNSCVNKLDLTPSKLEDVHYGVIKQVHNQHTC